MGAPGFDNVGYRGGARPGLGGRVRPVVVGGSVELNADPDMAGLPGWTLNGWSFEPGAGARSNACNDALVRTAASPVTNGMYTVRFVAANPNGAVMRVYLGGMIIVSSAAEDVDIVREVTLSGASDNLIQILDVSGEDFTVTMLSIIRAAA